MSTIVSELYELVQRGALGVGDTAPEAAKKACKIILENNYLSDKGWNLPVPPVPTQEKRTYVPRPGDKGHKMAAKKTGTCNICTGPILVGEDIYFKAGEGANHCACKDKQP